MVVATVLAHQGGWDEILMVAGPIVVFGGMLWVARRRALEQAERDRDGDPAAADD
jgi:hypothetical protein